MCALFLATRKRVGFYWGECNPSFKYHTAKADGAPGSGGRETRRGHRSPLPLSRQPGDQRADPGSAAGGRRGGLEKSRTPGKIDSGASHPGPQLPRGTRWRWGEPCSPRVAAARQRAAMLPASSAASLLLRAAQSPPGRVQAITLIRPTCMLVTLLRR